MSSPIIQVDRDVYLKRKPGKGWCVFTERFFSKDMLIMSCPVAVIGKLKKDDPFNDYPMYWDGKVDVIAFGAINLLNHAAGNAAKTKTCYLKPNRRLKIMSCYAAKDLRAGTELTIDYDCSLWFKVKK